jgi:arabinofuranosyltransferase
VVDPSADRVARAASEGARALGLAGLALATTLVYTAWLGDDCYFTLRTIDNFLGGEGLRWNTFERVQAYTHPLWLFVLSAAIALTGEHYLTTIAVSIACTLAACLVLLGAAASTRARLGMAALLLLSRAFVDYGTSGLENPLSFLLGALFLRELLRAERTPRSLARLALWAALASVTRLDSLLLYLPALALRALESTRVSMRESQRGSPLDPARALARTAGAVALGFAPLAAWELFSCFYYGFPFPNTAYAKLGTGIARSEYVAQGLRYLADSLRRDPPTLLALGAVLALSMREASRSGKSLALGLALYLAYVVAIGGDFMSGRFLALPFFLAVGLLGLRAPAGSPARARVALLAAFGLGLYLHDVTLALHDHEPRPLGAEPGMSAHGIDDERFCFYAEMGLFRPSGRLRPEPRLTLLGTRGVVLMSHGRQAFTAGPRATALEVWGLADPLLARLPARYDHFWRIGHFERLVPRGYERTLATGEDHLEDRALAEYHRRLRLVTSGPLLDPERLRTALALNLGRYDHLVDGELQRFGLRRKGTLRQDPDGEWRAERGLGTLAMEGALFTFERPLRVRRITIELAEPGLGAVLLRDGERVVREFRPALDAEAGRCVLEAEGEPATSVWVLPARRSRLEVTGICLTAD